MLYAQMPIFILCSPYSLDEYIARRIAYAFENLFFFPELNLFQSASLNDFIELNHGLMASNVHGLLRLVAEIYTGEQTIDSIETASRWIEQRLSLSSTSTYHELAAKVYPLTFVEKNVRYGESPHYLKRILTAFPNAIFIHLVRHPLSVCASACHTREGRIRLALRNSFDRSQISAPVLDPQILWHRINTNITDFLSDLPVSQKLTIKAEDFYSSEDEVIAKIGPVFSLMPKTPNQNVIRHLLTDFDNLGPFGAELGGSREFLQAPSRDYDASISHDHRTPLTLRSDQSSLFPHVIELAASYGYE